MPCQSKYEERVDAHGVVTIKKTLESFSDFAPDAGLEQGLQSYTKTVDSNAGPLYTIDQEVIDQGGTEHYSIEIGNSTEPIESHVRYSGAFVEVWQKQELKKWHQWKQDEKNPLLVGWLPNQSPSWAVQEFYTLWSEGITDYYEPKITLKKEIIEANPPNLDGLGLMLPSSIYPGEDNLENRNFLFIGGSGRQSGKWWTNTYEYLLSGAKGWNSIVYGGQ